MISLICPNSTCLNKNFKGSSPTCYNINTAGELDHDGLFMLILLYFVSLYFIHMRFP